MATGAGGGAEGGAGRAANEAVVAAVLPTLLEEVHRERQRMQGQFSEHLAMLNEQRNLTLHELQQMRVRSRHKPHALHSIVRKR
jgi:hypothetical protein